MYFLNEQLYILIPRLSSLDAAAPAIFPFLFPLLGDTFTNTFFPSLVHIGFLF